MENEYVFSIVSEESKKKCLEYSENPEKLQEVFSDPTFLACAKYLEIGKYFPEDKESRQILKFEIQFRGKIVSHRFGMSIHDTKILQKNIGDVDIFGWRKIQKKRKEIKESLLYSILASCNISIPNVFEDFCDEFGYEHGYEYGGMNTKVLEIWQDSLKIYNKFSAMFGEDFIEYFPQ